MPAARFTGRVTAKALPSSGKAPSTHVWVSVPRLHGGGPKVKDSSIRTSRHTPRYIPISKSTILNIPLPRVFFPSSMKVTWLSQLTSRKTLPGSDRIKEVLLDNDPRPVFVQVWGGPSTVARALKSIEDQYKGTPEWETIREKVSAKCKLCLSGAQDTSFRDYIQPNWPDVESIIINADITPIGYGASRGVRTPADTLYYSAAWTREHISSKGIFGELYRVWGDGKTMVEGDPTDYFGLSGYSADELRAMGYNVWTAPRPKDSFISEGDTPEFLNLIGNGLRAWQSPEWGGWAGRMRELSDREKQMGYSAPFASRSSGDPVLPDFVPAVQNGIAARMTWSTTADFSAANHEPKVSGPLSISAKPGATVKIKAKVSDPDGNALTCSWAQWKVYRSFQGDVTISAPSAAETSVTIPSDAKAGDIIHMILTVEDNGTPKLASYLRTVITVE